VEEVKERVVKVNSYKGAHSEIVNVCNREIKISATCTSCYKIFSFTVASDYRNCNGSIFLIDISTCYLGDCQWACYSTQDSVRLRRGNPALPIHTVDAVSLGP
jgi:hypothetical protein